MIIYDFTYHILTADNMISMVVIHLLYFMNETIVPPGPACGIYRSVEIQESLSPDKLLTHPRFAYS